MLIVYLGAKVFRSLPDWTADIFTVSENQTGWTLSKYNIADFGTEPESVTIYPATMFLSVESHSSAVKLEGIYRPSVSGLHYISYFSLGTSKVFVNNDLVLEVSKPA